jgi:hypothetical protein
MLGRQLPGPLLGAALLAALWSSQAAPAEDKNTLKEGGTVSGIVIDKRDNWMTVRADGTAEPVKYVLPERPSPAMLKVWKSIFTVGRVRLVYKMSGDSRQIVSLRKLVPGKLSGVTRGVVMYVHNDFWVELRQPTGPPEGYALGWPPDKAVTKTLKELRKGDVVVIRFYTDFERHRIRTIQKVGTVKKKDD